jgi:hypothetical protein
MRSAFGFVLLLWAAASVQAATYYVAQGALNASDQNPGTEQEPWKSLTHAAETVAKGDTVYVRAGTYRERMTLQGEGVTVQAFGDDSVVVEPAHQVTVIDPATWRKAPGRERAYTRDEKVGPEAKTCLLRVDGLALAFEVTQGSRRELISGSGEYRSVELERMLEDDEGQRWTVDREGNLYVNLGGEGPASHRVELIKAGPGGVSVGGKGCHVKGLQLRFCGLSVGGQDNIVEDCSVWKSTGAGWSAGWGDAGCGVSGSNVVRRCTFYRCETIGIGTTSVFEENLVVGGQRWVPEQEPPQAPHQLFSPIWGTALRTGNGHYALIRYNVVADSAIWGYWNDCMCYGTYMYGNAYWRNWSGAIYNEANCHDSKFLYNALVENGTHEHPWSGYGIMLSAAHRCLVAYNLCLNNVHFGIGSSLMRMWPNPLDNVVQHNLVKGSPYALYVDGTAPLQGKELHQLMTMTFEHNLYSLPPDGTFCKPGIATLADFQKLTSMDQDSRMDDAATMDDFGLGTVTFRVPDSDHPEVPVPMVVNRISRGLHQEPVATLDMQMPLFWCVADGGTPPSETYGRIYGAWWGEMFGGPVRRYARWSEDAVPGAPLPSNGEQPFWLEAVAASPDPVPKEGAGWWTRSLPTVPGAHIRLSLRVSGEGIEPSEAGGVVAYVRFCSPTDQHASRQYLIGGDQEVLKGTFPWRTFSKELVAPPEARRFALFIGLLPCKGTARFAELQMETLPGESPAEHPMPQGVTYQPLDLTKYFNHDLDENVTARIGEGLQGSPGPINLSKLPRGKQLYSGVPLEIDRAIALRGSTLPQDKSLPQKVSGIRVGQKVAGLYFLHRFAYPARDREQFRYILHFADGTEVEIPIISGEENILGRFQRNNVRLFPPPFDLVGGGGVAEWVNPKPTVVVESVDFVGADTGDAVLLGITAAVHQ